MKPFAVNSHGRLVLPSNFFPDLDFSVFQTLGQLEEVVRRDFEAKAPTGTDILERVESGAYRSRYELLRDVARNLTWVERFELSMYEKRPTRWRDVPRRRDDVFLPALTPWEGGERKVAAVESAYRALDPTWDEGAEERIFEVLFDIFLHRRHHASDLLPIKPTVAEFLAEPANRTLSLPEFDPDYRVFDYQEIIDCQEDVPELEALSRLAMVLHNQHPWDRAQTRLLPAASLADDDFVLLYVPRNQEVLEFIRRVKTEQPARPTAAAAPRRDPVEPLSPVDVREQFRVMPRLESLAAVEGEHRCSNEDLVRNSAYSWSPMTADEIREKTGVETRRYTQRGLEELSLEAAWQALRRAGRDPNEIGAVLFCSCTSTTLIPSSAAWLSGQMGMHQTHTSCDVIAACAGLPYGLAEAVRLLQEVDRPVLVVCAEKFSDKIGNVRPSRMIFGDGASALVVGPAPDGAAPDIDAFQTYASGPVEEVNSIIWPNPEFDNNITVYGPEVRSLVERYLGQMLDELRALPDHASGSGSLLDRVELVIPHQANKSMVTAAAVQAGLPEEQLYFDIDRVGNVSAASIPLAIRDAVEDGVIVRPTRVFAPGFGAGAVGGYVVMSVDPTTVARPPSSARGVPVASVAPSSGS